MNIQARFLSTENDIHCLPTHYTFPGADKVVGAQVLDMDRALEIAITGQDRHDDWFQAQLHTKLALLDVDGFSGDSIGIGYSAITEDDLVEMRTISVSGLAWALTEIAMELEEEGHDVPMDGTQYDLLAMVEELQEEVVSLLWEEADVVDPVFVDTLAKTA